MTKTANINMRTEPETKNQAEELFSSLGMTLTEAINIFLHQSIMVGGLPFAVRQPRYNAETEVAMEEARMIMGGQLPARQYSTVQELFDDLDEEMENE